ncbi:transporter, major facilitator domain protein [Actinomyces sp. Chiba101]|uniref:Glycoside/pentoside/hexuronide:cation symporter, GPH family n=1 Tax=Actinomyces denticolens TaxID=52767 RepID=A0ABY1I8Y6_9ACTO|nr:MULTISPECIES: MFS transporter [Actinomyces]BAW94145.1 transporter, major facilitator domain protein [Actinomyces sp. Chiba101]GAV95296.1 transporter, major facilitator family protein [Actinomyces denticolens]SHI79146.1 glycoside/pentoside/hexuronide:cation symporter, GPH family [Actinomyces denticolens]SUU13634.1 Inner membrane symporter yicJ [Actinomyces denticolens]
MSAQSPQASQAASSAEERRYLKWYNKVGYGSGDVAGNVVYVLLSAFVMIYLTDTAGLNPGIIGTLMMLSRLFDGFSDIVFGTLMDRTRTRMGKARPWMFWGFFGCAAMIIAVFAIPSSLGDTAKYAWFFIAYSLLNAVFYTANNIAYSALTALVTRNSAERVQMGSIRFIFAFSTSLLIQSVTVEAVDALGGGAQGWRAVAIIYALLGLAVNTLSVMSVKELPPEELEGAEAGPDDAGRGEGTAPAAEDEEKLSLRESLRLLGGNKYYLIILAVFLLAQVFTAMLNMGIYFMTYVLKDKTLLGDFAWAINIPLIAGLVLTPMIVSRIGQMYRVNVVGYVIAVVGRLGVVVAAYMGSVPLMLILSGVASLGMSPLQGTLNALIAEASENTWLRTGKRIDGLMFSCTSLGVKVGGGLGTAVAGWLLAFSGYDGNASVQADSVIQMLFFMYAWLPLAANGLILFLLTRLDVERVNARLKADAQ